MATRITDDDVGKRVETASGEPIGVVASAEGEAIRVEQEPGAIDTIKAAFGWEIDADEPIRITDEEIAAVTDDAVRLESAAPHEVEEGGTDPVIERDERTESEDTETERRDLGQGTGVTDEEQLADEEGRSGDGLEPDTEEMTEAGDERHPDTEEAPPEGDRTVTKDRGTKEDR